MSELHVYRNSVIDWVVATSEQDAAKVLRAYYADLGIDSSVDGDRRYFTVTQEPDSKVMTMRDDDPDNNPPRTCREWAELNGRGFLASTEW